MNPTGVGPEQRVPEQSVNDEPPPFLQTWRRVYAAIILYLIAVIALFAWFTRAFNR